MDGALARVLTDPDTTLAPSPGNAPGGARSGRILRLVEPPADPPEQTQPESQMAQAVEAQSAQAAPEADTDVAELDGGLLAEVVQLPLARTEAQSRTLREPEPAEMEQEEQEAQPTEKEEAAAEAHVTAWADSAGPAGDLF